MLNLLVFDLRIDI